MTKKNNYVVNEENKTVTYHLGSLTDKERAEVAEYNAFGYEIIIKKAKQKGLTFADMLEQAKGLPFEKELKKKIDAKENYMKVKKFFSEQIKATEN